MRLNVAYRPDAERVADAQRGLKMIPPADRIDHAEIRAAILACDQAILIEREARQSHIQAEQELPAAEFKDEQALADAQATGKKDPGPVHAEKQLALIRDLKRKHGASKITLQRAVAAVREAFEQYGDEWEARLEAERDAIREQISKALDEFADLHRRLQVNAANRSIGGSTLQSPSVFAQSINAPRIADGGAIPVVEVVERLRDLGAPRVVASDDEASDDDKPRDMFRGPAKAVDWEKRITEWQSRDEQVAREQAAALGTTSREARQAAAEERRQQREIRKAAKREAVEAAR